MAKIRHEINFINSVYQSTAGTGSTAFPNGERTYVDLTKFNGTVGFYFEVLATNTSGVSKSVAIQGTYGGLSWSSSITIPVGASNTLIRTSDYYNFVQSNGYIQAEYYITSCAQTATAGQLQIKAARAIIIQDTGTSPLAASETQIEIGNREEAKAVTTAGTLQPLTNPKYWYYDASKWDGACTFTAEVSWLVSGTTGNKTIVVQQSDGTGDGFQGWTTVATLVNAASGATTVARVRSTAFTPVDGRYYRLAWTNSSTMTTVSIFNAKIIVTQSVAYDTGAMATTNSGTYNPIYGTGGTNEEQAQAFRSTAANTVTYVDVYLAKSGGPTDSLVLEVRNIDNTTGVMLDVISSGNISASSVSTGGGWISVPLTTPASLASQIMYAIVIRRSGAYNTSAFYNWYYNSVDSIAGGTLTKNNGVWGTTVGINDYLIRIPKSPLTKLQEQYLLVNTAYAATLNVNMGYPTTFEPAEWSGVVTTFNHILDGSNDMNITVGLYDASNNLITGSTVYNPDNQKMSNVTGGNISVNQGGFNSYQGNLLNVGQIFFGASKPLTSASVWIKKTGTPTGTITAKLYATTLVSGSVYTVTGSPLATSINTISIANLATTYALYKFTFSSSSTLSNGTRYAIVFEQTPTGTSDISNYINFDGNPSSGSQAPGNFLSQNTSGGAWTTDVNSDLCWIMENDAGMTMPTTGQSIESRITLNATTIYASRINVDISPILDTTPPSVPTGLTEISTTYNSTTLSWTASTDNIGVAGYDVAVNGVYNKSVTATNATVTGLTYLTTYNITVRAKDAAGNTSAYSTALSITTLDRPPLNLNGNFFIFFN